MAGMLRVPRSRGALSGVLLILLGIWGGMIPFVGPYVHYAYTPTQAWAYTSGRFWLDILPAIGTVVGGLLVLLSSVRPTTLFGAWLAALSGTWFAVGSLIAPLVNSTMTPGSPAGGPIHRVVEQIGFFTGLGVAIVFFSSIALGRLSVLAMRDVRPVTETGPAGEPAGEPVGAPEADAAAAAASTAPRTTLTRVFPGRSARRPGRHGVRPGPATDATTTESVPAETGAPANR